MRRKAVLGKITPESYKDFLAAIQEAIKQYEGMGLQELHGLKEDQTPEYQTYKFMNGLGFIYGAALAKVYIDDLSADDQKLPDKIDLAIDHLNMIYNDVEARREMRDDVVIRMAAQELPEYVPGWVDLEKFIKEARASYQGKGVYFNDFYYGVLQSVNDISRAFRVFLLNEKRPEKMVFRKEKAGGEYIPSGLLDLNEQEERTLLKQVIREANKRISLRGHYGLRREPLPPKGDFSFLYWANGPTAWRKDNRAESAMIARDNGLTSVNLDANVVLIPFHEVLVEKVIDALDDIPLYTYSLEAKERGEYPEPTDRNVKQALRSIVAEGNPGLDQEEHTLMVAQLFDLLLRAKRHDPVALAQVAKLVKSQPKNLFPFVRLIEQWMDK
jgi:hypothetical protein